MAGPSRTARRLITLLSGILLALGAVLATAPGAQAASDLSDVADGLRDGPVYVDPAMRDQFPKSDADALAKKIKDADRAVFVAVLPVDQPTKNLFSDLRSRTGVTGVYGIRLGDAFDARADSRAMSTQSLRNILGSVKGEPLTTQLNDFTDQALRTANGSAPESWGGSDDGGVPVGALVGVGAVVVLGGAGLYAGVRRSRKRRAEEQRAALERLRVVVDEDITAFGEELDRLDFHPAEDGADDAMRADYERALDSYEQAKSIMASAQRPEDVRGVTEALEDGRFSLATLAARRKGGELPERRVPCFFDPRHGPSVADVTWSPATGAEREVPVCAADKARLEDGQDPETRTVDTAYGRRPYWDAGPAYGPWAGGYFGGGMLPGLLVGTMLGSAMASPAYASDYGSGYGDFGGQGGFDGGDVSGSDFNPGDFGDFGGGGGGFGGDNNNFGGGGDFGGGF
ncbi:hypothetical protein [Streptomyces tsukubensis]|uniref:Uncharacterized protein n=1 Tax=Streptomyces tsukubensis TaxID=83656 RepID=A0A1V4AA55_9ACTN|nr:hypothetical protein B1H18_14290 [Streptomyces tsukubensis]QFR98035.1 hypothetical protein GBW32_26320 [Streptomyces tsukubensis]